MEHENDLVKSVNAKTIFIATIGSILEFFDFTIFALLTPYISQVFFPEDAALPGLMKSYGILAIGYLSRPIGAFFMGHLGDCYGRKAVFTLSLLLMALSTFIIGLLPTYYLIGIGSPILLLIFRILQGFSFSGEVPGATIFLAEHLSIAKRGLGTSFVFSGLTAGSILGGLMSLLLSTVLSESSMLHFGWRLPFIFGGIIGVIGFWIRRSTSETPIFAELEKKQKILYFPLKKVFKKSWRSLIVGFFLTALTAGICSYFLFLPTFYSLFLRKDISMLYFLTMGCFLLLGAFAPLFGYASDLSGRKIWILLSSVFCAFFAYLFLDLSLERNFLWLWLILGIINASALGTYGIAIAELFSTDVRLTGMAISHNIGYALFGGLGPFFFTFLIHITQDVYSSLYYIYACCLLTFITALCFKDRNETSLDEI